MNSRRNQFILLGLICQGFSWDNYWPMLSMAAAWFLALWPRGWKPKTNLAWEGFALAAGCLVTYQLARISGQSTHFFIGNGLAFIQLLRLCRPLEYREKIFSILIACFHLAVGFSVLLDLRLFWILLPAIYFLPAALAELTTERMGLQSPSPRIHGHVGAYLALLAAAIVTWLAIPRFNFGTPLPNLRGSGAEDGTLLDSVLDPRMKAARGSNRILMQIEGEKLGYLRCFTLPNFDGQTWFADKRAPLKKIPFASPDKLNGYAERKVLVKNPLFLGKLLPNDGRVTFLRGNFFRIPLSDGHGGIECEAMWNTSRNIYEYYIDPNPAPEQLSEWQRKLYTYYPNPSKSLKNWIEQFSQKSTNDLDLAVQLEKHFQTEFKYSLGAPELNRLQPVEEFLFTHKEGHCERFAAAMASLLRLQGIPARVVIGYLPRNRNLVSGRYTIRFSDAHAWTEAYIEGRGWTVFDGTPAGEVGNNPGFNFFSDVWENVDFLWYSKVVNFDWAAQRMVFSDLRNLSSKLLNLKLVFALGFLVGTLLFLHFFRSRIWRTWYGKASNWLQKRHSTKAEALTIYQEMLAILEQKEIFKPASFTPLEFENHLSHTNFPGGAEVKIITQYFCLVYYGNQPRNSSTDREIKECLSSLRAKLKRWEPEGKALVRPQG